MSKFFNELKRRNVIKAAIAYIVVAWLLLQVFSIVLPNIGAPEWVMQLFMLIMAIGFPLWLFFSWVYEFTHEGVKKTSEVEEDLSVIAKTNKRLNILILVAFIATTCVMIFNPSTDLMKTKDGKYAIAVLYFDNMSADEENEWLSEGMTESITTHLKPNKNLIVIGRTSVKKYRDSEDTIPEIASELSVSYVVEGSVMKQGNNLKITAQLINANNEHVWSEEYIVSFEDYLNVQTEIAKKIIQKLKIYINPEEENELAHKPTESIEAFKLYQKGRAEAEVRSKEGLESSIEYYQKAIETDSNYAVAYAEIANSYYLLMIRGLSGDVGEKIDQLTNRSLEIDPNTVRAYTVKAIFNWNFKNKNIVKEYFEKAIFINSGDATAHHHYSFYLRDIGDNKKALEQINIAFRIEPFSFPIIATKINFLLINDKIIEADELYKKNETSFNDNLKTIYQNKFIFANARKVSLEKKDWTEAIRFYTNKIVKDPNNSTLYNLLGLAYNEVLNDDISSLIFTKKAYELDSTKYINKQDYFSNAKAYYFALLEGKRFKEAYKLLQTKNFELVSEEQKSYFLFYYYYHQENYINAQEVLEDLNHSWTRQSYYFKMTINYAQLGDRVKVDSLLENKHPYGYRETNMTKAFVYAILEEKDSMYYYLDKVRNTFSPGISDVNSQREFDPYRKEERYKAFLKKNYLPLTHWNE